MRMKLLIIVLFSFALVGCNENAMSEVKMLDENVELAKKLDSIGHNDLDNKVFSFDYEKEQNFKCDVIDEIQEFGYMSFITNDGKLYRYAFDEFSNNSNCMEYDTDIKFDRYVEYEERLCLVDDKENFYAVFFMEDVVNEISAEGGKIETDLVNNDFVFDGTFIKAGRSFILTDKYLYINLVDNNEECSKYVDVKCTRSYQKYLSHNDEIKYISNSGEKIIIITRENKITKLNLPNNIFNIE